MAKKRCPRAGQGNGGGVAERTTSKPRPILYHNGGHLVEHSEQAAQSSAVIVVPFDVVQVPFSQSSVSVLPSFVVTVTLPVFLPSMYDFKRAADSAVSELTKDAPTLPPAPMASL